MVFVVSFANQFGTPEFALKTFEKILPILISEQFHFLRHTTTLLQSDAEDIALPGDDMFLVIEFI